MNWWSIGVTILLIFISLVLFIKITDKNSPVNLLNKQINKLNVFLNCKIFKNEEIYGLYGGCTLQIRFEKTKNNLLEKAYNVNSIICNMINLYVVDDKINNFYKSQLNSLNKIIVEIENKIDSLANYNKGNNYELSESDKVQFNKLNNKLNNKISSFLIGNAKFFTNLKYNSIRNTYGKLTYEEYLKKYKKLNILKYILSFIISLLIGILTNYISALIGI